MRNVEHIISREYLYQEDLTLKHFTYDQKARLKNKLLVAIMRHGNTTRACEEAKVSRRTFYAWWNSDKRFKANVVEARAACYAGQ